MGVFYTKTHLVYTIFGTTKKRNKKTSIANSIISSTTKTKTKLGTPILTRGLTEPHCGSERRQTIGQTNGNGGHLKPYTYSLSGTGSALLA